MHQFIKISGSSWGKCSIKINQVFQVNGQLYAICRICDKRGSDVGGEDSVFYDHALVETTANEALPVTYVLTDVEKRDLQRFRDPYPEHYCLRGENLKEFKLVLQGEQFTDLPLDAQLVYPPAAAHLTSFRMPVKGALQLSDPEYLPNPLPPLNNILNIYSEMQNDVLKFVFEAIYTDDNIIQPRQLLPAGIFDGDIFDREYTPVLDQEIYFTAQCNQQTRLYRSSALSLAVPANDITSVMNLLNYVTKAWKAAQKDQLFTLNNSKCYDLVMSSCGSVFGCYDEALLVYKPIFADTKSKADDARRHRQIVNELPVTMEYFIYQPHHYFNLEDFRRVFAIDLLSHRDYPAYASLQDFFRQYRGQLDAIFNHPVRCLEAALNINLLELHDTNTSMEEREKLLAKVEEVLKLVENRAAFRYFLDRFNDQTIIHLLVQYQDKLNYEGKKYTSNCPEIQLLMHADFGMQDDGKMFIHVKSNPVYLTTYAEGCQYQGIYETAMNHLAAAFGLAFVPGSDYRERLLLTDESTRLLKSFGLHLAENYWDHKKDVIKPTKIFPSANYGFFGMNSVVEVKSLSARQELGQ